MSIQKRTVYYDRTDGVVRFWDWATVTTTLGSMVEPFSVDRRHAVDVNIRNFDPTDEIARIDDMKEVSIDKQKFFLSGSGADAFHGGIMIPRVGK